MDQPLKQGTINPSDEFLWIILDYEKNFGETQFQDVRINCSNCSDYHSIYIPCPLNRRLNEKEQEDF